MLRHEDKFLIVDTPKTVGKSKSVFHCNQRKLEETGLCEAKKLPDMPRKTPQGMTDGLVMNQKGSTATAISKRANVNLGIKTSRHSISRRLEEINFNSRVASTKP